RTHDLRRFGITVGAVDVPLGVAAGYGAVWVLVARGKRQVVLELGPDLGDLRRTIPFGGEVRAFYRFSVQPLAVGAGAVWAVDSAGGKIWRIDPKTGRPREFANGVDAVTLAVGGGAVWAAGSSGVTKLDAVSGLVLDSSKVGAESFAERISVEYGRNAVWYAASSNRRLAVLDPTSVETTQTFAV